MTSYSYTNSRAKKKNDTLIKIIFLANSKKEGLIQADLYNKKNNNIFFKITGINDKTKKKLSFPTYKNDVVVSGNLLENLSPNNRNKNIYFTLGGIRLKVTH